MHVDLFIKKLPRSVKALISREAFENRRSINQEAIALLEEALISRVGATATKRQQMEALIDGYAETRAADADASRHEGKPGPHDSGPGTTRS